MYTFEVCAKLPDARRSEVNSINAQALRPSASRDSKTHRIPLIYLTHCGSPTNCLMSTCIYARHPSDSLVDGVGVPTRALATYYYDWLFRVPVSQIYLLFYYPQSPKLTCQILYRHNKQRLVPWTLRNGGRYCVYEQTYPLLIIIRIALSLSFFRIVGERVLFSARYTYRSLLQSPMHLAHTFTVSLSLIRYQPGS